MLSKYFAGIAIVLSCLGLFALATFTAQKRQKEIGIRKVLGASEFGIIRLLSGDFTKLVVAAIVIALPVSYLITKNWLESFAYRIDLEVVYFVGAALITLAIAWLTVGVVKRFGRLWLIRWRCYGMNECQKTATPYLPCKPYF